MSLEMLRVIIAACSIGSSGMGGNYSGGGLILEHQKQMAESNLNIQRECQNKIISCVTAKSIMATTFDLTSCLLKK